MQTQVFFKTIKEEIISQLKSATINIKVAVAWLTDEDIIRILIQKQLEGLHVQIIISNAKENFVNISKFKSFLQSEGDFYIAHSPFMHNKFCIIDDRVIINGSYNWSYSAIRSEENILVLIIDKNEAEDDKLLKKFNTKFNYLYSKCSLKISNMIELNNFRNNPVDSINLLLKFDEAEIQLRKEFEEEVQLSINKSKEKINIDYLGLLDRMKLDGGGVNFVKRLLNDEISSGVMKPGFKKLENTIPHSVDLSMEYLVSKSKYHTLFTQEEISFCVNLMTKYRL